MKQRYIVEIDGSELEDFTALELCEILRKELGEVSISVKEEL